jgi:hypothetical protein
MFSSLRTHEIGLLHRFNGCDRISQPWSNSTNGPSIRRVARLCNPVSSGRRTRTVAPERWIASSILSNTRGQAGAYPNNVGCS